MRRFAFLCGLLTLAACSTGPGSGTGAPLASMSFAGGAVVVAGPEGYCIDPATTNRQANVAVLASCLILSGGEAGPWVPPALVTVTVGPRGSQSDLPEAAALAKAAGVPLLAGGRKDGLVIAHLGRGGDSILPEGDSRYWRGAFVEGGRMIGLALYAPKGDALTGREGAAMLARVRASISKASAARGRSTQAARDGNAGT